MRDKISLNRNLFDPSAPVEACGIDLSGFANTMCIEWIFANRGVFAPDVKLVDFVEAIPTNVLQYITSTQQDNDRDAGQMMLVFYFIGLGATPQGEFSISLDEYAVFLQLLVAYSTAVLHNRLSKN